MRKLDVDGLHGDNGRGTEIHGVKRGKLLNLISIRFRCHS